jgi:uncharacterized protein YodC (DUF2158 family)
MSEEIKLGDIVMLKSGGPTMTVANLGDGDRVYAVWFQQSWDVVIGAWFTIKTLKKVLL